MKSKNHHLQSTFPSHDSGQLNGRWKNNKFRKVHTARFGNISISMIGKEVTRYALWYMCLAFKSSNQVSDVFKIK